MIDQSSRGKVRIQVALTDEEMKALNQRAKKAKMKATELLRNEIKNADVKKRMNFTFEDSRRIIEQITWIRSNLSSIKSALDSYESIDENTHTETSFLMDEYHACLSLVEDFANG